MNIRLLLQGFNRYTTTIGQRLEIIRLAPCSRLDADCRKVTISYAPVLTRCSSLLPWVREQVIKSWDVTATIKRKDGRTYTVSKLVGEDFERATEFAMLEVVKKATLDQLKQMQAPVAPRPVRMR